MTEPSFVWSCASINCEYIYLGYITDTLLQFWGVKNFPVWYSGIRLLQTSVIWSQNVKDANCFLPCTVGSHFATVRLTTINFYDHCQVRTKHSRIVVHHCHNSRVLSLISVLPALFRCTCVSFFYYISSVLLS